MTRFRLPGARQLAQWAKAGAHVLREQGPGALLAAASAAIRREAEAADADYAGWARDYATPSPLELAEMREAAASFAAMPVFSILIPVHDTPEALLRRAFDSVIAQAWPHWQLCVADDASTKPHVMRLLESYRQGDARILVVRRAVNGHISAASNSALALATGEFVALLDHDDELSPDALFWMAREANAHPDLALAYSDEDKLDPSGRRAAPHFKTDWNPELLLGHNFVAHLAVYRTDLVRRLGGFRPGFEGAQDYDLALRVAEAVAPARIRHVPRVLYHWRMTPGSTALGVREKGYAAGRARLAVQEHLARRGIAASVEPDARLGAQRVRFALPDPPPTVAVLVEGGGLEAVNAATDYPGARFLAAGDRNALAREAGADVIVFLGAGLVPRARDWLAELAAQAIRPGVGAVGGRILAADGSLVHAGLILGAGFGHRGRPRGDPGYMNRAELLQQVSAVTGDCLAVRRALLDLHGGFDPELAAAFDDADLCLRLEAAGHRTIYAPHALLVRDEASPERPACEAEAFERHPREAERLSARWGARLDEDPFYGPNLMQASPNFALARPPRVPRWGEEGAP